MQHEARSAELDRQSESLQTTEQELLTREEAVKKSEGVVASSCQYVCIHLYFLFVFAQLCISSLLPMYMRKAELA